MNVEIFGMVVEIDGTILDAPATTIREQVLEYERGERRSVDVPVALPADLTGDVMAAMVRIPYGETRTYGELAEELGAAPVEVGAACGRNPVPIVVPCHRVVGADSLGGFSAGGARSALLKRRLLHLEAGQRTLV
ncbi:methylated-DNA--[protein]-cysteine S-methyltransferase [Halomarina halobia]|uniref:Methylated-DNA--[protein]-cysteine S-methyltransferase n=1 Tax=Halomarina halobia TaxID=3033386 RepID=A0ABD6A825_9EURY|nr:methylated-DNA--[protein]-cysteine S-methyltransferase [Halomarina sp. PSR21]